MILKTKWHMRQIAIGYIMCAVSFTAYCIVRAAINLVEFAHYGQRGFPDFPWLKHMTDVQLMSIFYENAIYPYLAWIPVALLVDLVLRRFFFRLNS